MLIYTCVIIITLWEGPEDGRERYGEGEVSIFQLHPFPFILESIHMCEIKECRKRKRGRVVHEGSFTVISIHLNLINSSHSFPATFCF